MARKRHPPANEEIAKLRKEVSIHVIRESRAEGERNALRAENQRLRSTITALNHTMRVLAPETISNLAIIITQLQTNWVD